MEKNVSLTVNSGALLFNNRQRFELSDFPPLVEDQRITEETKWRSMEQRRIEFWLPPSEVS